MAANDPRSDRPTWARRALVAAAVKINDLVTPGTGTGGKRNADSEAWIEDAWAYRDTVPQVMFAARFLGNAASRLVFYPAIEVGADGDVISVQEASQPRKDENGEATEPALISEALARAAVEEFDRLRSSPDGLAGLQSQAAVNITIGGEVYLVGRDTDDGETWFMQSKACVKETETAKVYEVNDPDTGRKLRVDATDDGPDFLARIWRRHPRYPWKPDSNIRAITDLCEEFLIINRSMRSIGKSRNNAGILKLPNELDQAPVDAPVADGDYDPDSEDPPEDGLTDFEAGIVLSMVTPTEDDGSAASVAPHMVRGPGEALQYLDWVEIGRKYDPEVIARLDWIVRNMAQGVDLPPEILTGLADANHWTGWLIEDTTYKAHVEPLALLIAGGWATAFLRPALRARGFSAEEVRQVTIGVDPSGLVVRPNRFADATTVFEQDGLSWEALRRYGGFSDDDAPTPEEMIVRYVFSRGIGSAGLTRELMALIGVEVEEAEPEVGQPEPGAEGADDAAPEDGGDPTPGTEDDQPAGGDGGRAAVRRRPDANLHRTFAAIVAAGNAQSDLGPRLAAIDGRLRERLQTAASAAMLAALDRAGKRLRAAVQGQPDVAGRVKGVDNAEVGGIVGEGVVDPTELLSADDFDGLHQQWTAWTGQAAAQAVDTVRADPSVRELDQARVEAGAQDALGTVEGDRDAGWALLLTGLLSLGRARIFTPDGTPDEGEFDPNLSVPPGLVRESLTVAGGGSATGSSAAGTSGGPASGESMMRYVRTLGAVTVAWRWETGMPARPFHPHHQLAGFVFSAWDDPRLVNGQGYPGGAYYRPGDHKGCQCDAVPLLVFDPSGDPKA